MGEIADQIIDSIIMGNYDDEQSPLKSLQKGAGKGMWRNQTGLHAMTDMSTFHLTNCIAMCKRTGNNGKADDIRKELKRRGTP